MEIVAETVATDEAEDEELGERRGDELPEQLRTPEGRREFFRHARRQRQPEQRRSEPAGEPETEGSEEVPLELAAEGIVGRGRQGRDAWLREGKRQLEQHRWEEPDPVSRSREERLLFARRSGPRRCCRSSLKTARPVTSSTPTPPARKLTRPPKRSRSRDWQAATGQRPALLVFDSKVTTGAGLAELHAAKRPSSRCAPAPRSSPPSSKRCPTAPGHKSRSTVAGLHKTEVHEQDVTVRGCPTHYARSLCAASVTTIPPDPHQRPYLPTKEDRRPLRQTDGDRATPRQMIRSFHLDALSSAVALNADLDTTSSSGRERPGALMRSFPSSAALMRHMRPTGSRGGCATDEGSAARRIRISRRTCRRGR